MSCVQHYATLWTVAHQAPVHGVLQARILEWVAIPFCTDLLDPGIEPGSLALQAYSTIWATRKAHKIYLLSYCWVSYLKQSIPQAHNKWWFPSSSNQICPSRPNVCALAGVQHTNNQQQQKPSTQWYKFTFSEILGRNHMIRFWRKSFFQSSEGELG